MYKIVTGYARDVENKLNELSVKYWIIFHGVSADKDQTTVVVDLNERSGISEKPNVPVPGRPPYNILNKEQR